MKKQRSGLIIGLTILIIAFCAILPILIAKIGDHITDDRVQTAEVKSVQFVTELSDLERIYLLENGMNMDIDASRANIRKEELMETLEAALSPYFEYGFLQGSLSDFTVTHYKVQRCYSNEFSNLSGTFWEVTLEYWDELGQSIHLVLDDATGKVILLSYDSLEPIYGDVSLSSMAEGILDVYRTMLDMNYIVDYLEQENKKAAYASSIRLYAADMLYGELGIKITVTQNGFSIYLDSYGDYNSGF